MISLSTQHLSADGARVLIDENKSLTGITADTALAILRAFTAVPDMELVGVDSKIYLTGPKEKVAVQKSRGKLLVALLPEVLNTWEECTPEQTLARVTGGTPAAAPGETVRQVAIEDEALRAVRGTAGWRDFLGSGWVLGGLVVIALLVAWVNLSPGTPEGVTLIRESSKISQLHGQFNGRYGVGEQIGQALVELANGTYRSLQVGTDGADKMVAEATYRFGLRDQSIVVVVDNGAILELLPDGGLKFLDEVYPRQSKRR